MRLAPPLRRFVGLFLVAAALCGPHAAVADGHLGTALGGDSTGKAATVEGAAARVLWIGGGDAPRTVAGRPMGEALVALDRLPDKDGIDDALYGARLRAQAVSTFPDTRPAPPAAFEEFHLVVRAGLTVDGDGIQVTLGGEAFGPAGFGARLADTTAAFEATHRRIAFVEIVDPENAFVTALPALRAALDPLGFDMQVLMISRGADGSCGPDQPLPLSLASGLADRTPFGNGNGETSIAEAETFLADALRRGVARGCDPAYSLIVKAEDVPAHVVVAHPMALGAAVEDRLDREAFEAMFLAGSDDATALADYLERCTYCPGEASLRARLDDIAARTRVAQLEDEMWDDIKDDDTRDRLAIYVDHCRVCAHSDAALTRIERLDAVAEAAERERRAFARAKGQSDLAGLRTYVERCVACTFADEARALIGEVEGDADYQAERALLAAALAAGDPDDLASYLDQCTVCDGAADARAALDRRAALNAARGPCVALAGLPQAGGPRRLEDIDQAAARTTCGAASEAHPEDGLLRVLIGRIAQAAGDDETARAAYDFGMDQGVPAAFGLAAYAAYAPANGGPIDPDRVEALALKGADLGDWLSQEVLTVLYSKDLVAGKSGAEAFAVAMKIAEEGNPLAQFLVGHYHLTGIGTDPSDAQAAKWFEAAVEAGYTQAAAFLAGIYERGTEALARPDRAGELYWSALAQGDAAARVKLTSELAERSAEVVRIIQGKLREQGLYRGAVDGVPGPGTEAAILAHAERLGSQG